jgi:hypothetical protein
MSRSMLKSYVDGKKNTIKKMASSYNSRLGHWEKEMRELLDRKESLDEDSKYHLLRIESQIFWDHPRNGFRFFFEQTQEELKLLHEFRVTVHEEVLKTLMAYAMSVFKQYDESLFK